MARWQVGNKIRTIGWMPAVTITDVEGMPVADVRRAEDAARILHAVNHHTQLVWALNALLADLKVQGSGWKSIEQAEAILELATAGEDPHG